MTYEFTTHDQRSGEVTVDANGIVESGVFIFGEDIIPIQFLDSDRPLSINHPSFLTITLKENQ